MIHVYPGASNPTHDFGLSDGVQTWGMRLDGGAEAIKEEPLTPSTLRLSGGISGFGSWEPGMAQIEQRDWSGGRGAQRFSAQDAESARRFYDSMNAWTLTPGILLPAPQWRLARGLSNTVQHLPGSVQWQGIIGAQRFMSALFTIGSIALTPAKACIWLRRVGSPGALSLVLYEDENGLPSSALHDAGETITIADVPDVISRFHNCDVSAYGSSLLAGIDYHIVLSAPPTDNAANHWEIGVDKDWAGGHISADGIAWTSTKFCTYHRVQPASIDRSFLFFQFAGAFYAIDQKADGSPSHLYLNGDRGLATSGTANTLEDAHNAWLADQWTDAWVRIVRGKGAGQARRIQSNAAMDLIVEPWDLAPDTTSEYVIYASDLWRDISPTSGDLIDGVVTDVQVVDDFVLFAQGPSAPILRMRFNTALAIPAHEFDDDGVNVADQLHIAHHSTAGPQIWRALAASSEVSRATATAWGTALTFGAGIQVGDKSHSILELFDFGGQLWALKASGAWTIDESDKAHQTALALGDRARTATRALITEFGGDLLLGLDTELLQYAGGELVDIAPGGDQGLPAERNGRIAALQPLSPARLAVAMDASAGESSVMIWQDESWHEIFRAAETGQRISALGLQECPGTRSRLWITLDGDLAYVALPHDVESPLGDGGLAYQHEAVMMASTVDMGAALLPKFLKQLTLWSANLSRGIQVNVEYQLDGEIGSAGWRSAGAIYSSPLESLPLEVGPLHAIRIRLHLQTNDALTPPVVQATILEGFARTPLKYQWSLRVRLADLQADYAGGVDTNPDAFILWLQQAARQARKIYMRSVWQALDDKYVIVEPPALKREYIDGTQWGGTAMVVLREA